MNTERLKFWLRAKGRHGTHSPFVYAFIEQVLRSKEIFKKCPAGFSEKGWQRLNATLKYLEVDEVLFSKDFSDEMRTALSRNWPRVNMKAFNPDVSSTATNSLLLLCPGDNLRPLPDTARIHPDRRFCIYVVQPHFSGSIPTNIELLGNDPGFKMILDFWQGLLLVRSDDFKEKQFFELR